uniref:VC0807 family protein n=2 Tax=Streptomyces TaxID=1883 RepID=UPI0023813744|nr:VC0807 family protein [Streptomyces sp. WZ-12]
MSHQPSAGSQLVKTMAPLVLDLGIPLASYYVLKNAFDLGDVAALAWSSVVPALRTVWSLVRERTVNGLALLILLVNVVGLATSTMTGDPRLMMAKDSGVSSVIGLAVLFSVWRGRPLMTAGLKPWVTKGSSQGVAAWDRLMARGARFRRLERRFSVIWGSTLLVECAVKAAGAYLLPVHTMVWLGTVLTVVALLFAMVVAGGAAAEPMERMVRAEAAGGAGAAADAGKDAVAQVAGV